MIFSISSNLDKASKITESGFNELHIWERQHIQEWVRTNPDILGEDLLIVSIEFDRFSNSDDRLDILALDRSGNLVIIELKRNSAARYADLQAIRYAAMVSSMAVELFMPYYISCRKRYYDETLSESEAQDQLIEFIESDSLTRKIFKNSHPGKKNPGVINGNKHWVNEAGKSLLEVAEEYLEKNT